jgi:hypothetical protein
MKRRGEEREREIERERVVQRKRNVPFKITPSLLITVSVFGSRPSLSKHLMATCITHPAPPHPAEVPKSQSTGTHKGWGKRASKEQQC